MVQVRSHYVSSPRSPIERGGVAGIRPTEFCVELPPITAASRAVVLLYGPGSESQESVRLEPALREHGFHVATLSSKELQDRTRPSFWRWISDGLAEVDRQSATYDEVNLCGINYGAALTLAVAAERSTKLDSLALISPRLHPNARALARPHVPMLRRLKDWRASIRYRFGPGRVTQEADSESPALGRKAQLPPTAGAAFSSQQRREVRQLARHVDNSLGRVSTPTLIICGCEDAAMVTNVRHLQIHIGSQFLEVFLESREPLTVHEGDFERMVLKVVEFFNDVARRRALAAMTRS